LDKWYLAAALGMAWQQRWAGRLWRGGSGGEFNGVA